ncbi:hypothetical protein JOD24_000234 [Kroppenstedtia sanguinis]
MESVLRGMDNADFWLGYGYQTEGMGCQAKTASFLLGGAFLYKTPLLLPYRGSSLHFTISFGIHHPLRVGDFLN